MRIIKILILLFISVCFISCVICYKHPSIDDYKGGEINLLSNRFRRFYNAHWQRNQEQIYKAEKELQKVAAKSIKPNELEKKDFELEWQAEPSNFSMNNALACQVDPMGDMLAILEKFNDDYTTYLIYKGETIKLNQGDERLVNGNLRVKFYLPFRWSHTSDIIAYSANNKAYNQLFLAFVIKYEEAPLSILFQVTDALKDVFYYDPVWSFNDEFLAYTQENKDGSTIRIIDLKKQKISSLELEKQAHCFRFSPKVGYAAFAVVKENDNYVPIVFSDWRIPESYTPFPSLSCDCPLMRASYSNNGDRIALLQYTSSNMDSLRLAVIDIESKQVYIAEKRLVEKDVFEYEVSPMSDPFWLYDDNYLISTSKKEIFYSFVNRISLDKAYDILYLQSYTKANISNVISPSFSTVKNEVILYNPIENNNAYTFKNFSIKKYELPELVQTMYWETMIEDFDNKKIEKNGRIFNGKTKLKIIGNNPRKKETIPPDHRNEDVVFKMKVDDQYINVLHVTKIPQAGDILIMRWDIKFTHEEEIRKGTFYTEVVQGIYPDIPLVK